jgi:putative transposase
MLPSMGQHKYHLLPRQRYQMVKDHLGGHNVANICRFYGIPRKTFYYWLRVWQSDPGTFLKKVAATDTTPQTQPRLTDDPTTKFIIRLRKKSRFGPQKLQLLLKERGVMMSASGIYKVLRRANLVKKHRRKLKKKYKKYTAFMVRPGQKVQVDVAYLPKLFGKPYRQYVYQAIDLYTRITFSAVYSECCPANTVHFLKRLIQFLPFTVEVFQFDHGSEFTYDMFIQIRTDHPVHTYLRSLNIAFCFSLVATPRTNGCVERVHRTWREELQRWHQWSTLSELLRDNQKWMKYYNEQRPHFGIKLKTPLQQLQTVSGHEQAQLNYAI